MVYKSAQGAKVGRPAARGVRIGVVCHFFTARLRATWLKRPAGAPGEATIYVYTWSAQSVCQPPILPLSGPSQEGQFGTFASHIATGGRSESGKRQGVRPWEMKLHKENLNARCAP